MVTEADGDVAETDVEAEAAQPVEEPDAPPLVLQAGHYTAVVDTVLAKRLAEHQVEGLRWLFAAVHGEHRRGWRGGLLCDGMGVGKTLQTLALVHTLVVQKDAADADLVEAEAEMERAVVDTTSMSTVPPVDVSRVVRYAMCAEKLVWVV